MNTVIYPLQGWVEREGTYSQGGALPHNPLNY